MIASIPNWFDGQWQYHCCDKSMQVVLLNLIEFSVMGLQPQTAFLLSAGVGLCPNDTCLSADHPLQKCFDWNSSLDY